MELIDVKYLEEYLAHIGISYEYSAIILRKLLRMYKKISSRIFSVTLFDIVEKYK